MRRERSGIGSRLLALALLNAAALAVVAVIVSLAFDRLEHLSAHVAGKELSGVLENAALGRDLLATLSEIDLVSRSCQGPVASDTGKRVAGELARIAVSAQDQALEQDLATLSTTSASLLDDCANISVTLARLAGMDRDMLGELAALESLTGRALVDQTLAGRNTDYLDQIMTLVTGYRETLLEISKAIALAGTVQTPQVRSVHPALALVDDLILRLQTLTASPPEMERIARRLLRQAAAYREQVVRLDAALRHFSAAQQQSHLVQEKVLASLKRLDSAALDRTAHFRAELKAVMQESNRRVLWIAGAIALLSLAFAAWVIRRQIKRPLDVVLHQIAALREGTQVVPVTPREDEWGTIQSALSDLSADLEKSLYLLQKIIDTAPIRVFWKDRDLRYLGCNPAFARDAGKADPHEIIGRDDYQMGWAEQADLYRGDDRRVMESGVGRLAYEEVQTTPTGDTIWLRTSKVPLHNRANEIIGVLGIYEDITAQKRVEAELDRYRANLEQQVERRTAELQATEARASHILQSSADGLYGVDGAGRVTFINPAACALLGYSPEQVVGRSAHDLFHHSHPGGSPYPSAECPSHHALLQGQEIRIDDEVYWHADGHAVPVMYALHPMLQDERVTGAVVSFVDMSLPRAAAQAREQALIAAETLARLRSEFLANMSHEIRTPLNGVLGFAQIGRRNSHNPDKARDAFDKILASGSRLLGVINDILDFSKIEAGKLAIEAIDFNLDESLDHALELVADRAHAKGLELRLEKAPGTPSRCNGDPLRLGQVLLNLLSNAVKFTETGRVTVSAALRDGRLVFAVSDTGIGMSPDQVSHLFNPFQQADGSTTRRFGGTGLGLAISKRILELMHGEIRGESIQGSGSRFEFHLPYIPAAAPAPSVAVAVPGATRPLAGISILVAEDDAINQAVLDENLREDGARVVLVGNGREAVERVICDGEEAYDIVLMDVQMPVMDGLEATRRILELAPGLPVIGQTAHALGEEKAQCFAAGMVGHIAKPIDPDALVAIILEHLERG